MTKDYWKDFAASGKVSDYLSYCKQQYRGESGLVQEGKHESENRPDRHGPVRDACR